MWLFIILSIATLPRRTQSSSDFNPSYPNARELAGEVTSKGIELDIMSRPIVAPHFLAGIATMIRVILRVIFIRDNSSYVTTDAYC